MTTASCSFCTIGAGVPAGTHRPYHEVISKPARPDSIAVGISGNAGERFAEVTTMGRTVPARIWPTALPSASKTQSISPPMSACIAGPVPLYGTCVAFTPAAALKSSHERWREVPLPAEPQLSLPGLALAQAMSSGKVLAGTRFAATSTSGKIAAVVDRNEVLLQVVGQRLVRGGGDGAVHRVQQHRVAVRRRLRCRGGADRAAGAAAVVDDDLLAEDCPA